MDKIAIAASPPAASADPPLNPNQPTQSIAAPVMVIVILCGGIGFFGNPRLGPNTIAATNAAIPAVI